MSESLPNALSGIISRLTALLRAIKRQDGSIHGGANPLEPNAQSLATAPNVPHNAGSKQQPRLATFGGISCVCNLEWTSITEQNFQLSSTRGFTRLTWGDRIASAIGPEFEGQPALLQLAASTLDAADRSGVVMIVVSFPDRDQWFTALLVEGKPVLEQERVFDKKSDLIRHVSSVANTPAVARVFCSDDLLCDLNLMEPAKPLIVEQLDPRAFASFKRNSPIFSKPVAIALGAVASVVGVGMFTNAILVPMLVPAPPLQSERPMMSYMEDYGVFAQGCEAAFSTPWPTAPGWALDVEGCATKGMNDPEISSALSKPAAAYQVFTLKPQHNAILARRTAEHIYAEYPHDAVVDRGKLIIFKPFPITLSERPDLRPSASTTKQPLAHTSLLHQSEDAFLGVEAGIKANTGSVAGKALPKVEITTPASLSEVLRRIATLNEVSLAKLHRKNGLIDITLTSPRIILRPAPEGNS